MRAHALIVAEADPAGRTRLVDVRGEVPLLPRRTGSRADGGAVVHLVGGAAGPLGGDELTFHLEVGEGASLEVRSVAATIVYPGNGTSRLAVTANVATGGTLHWLPEPLIATAGCVHIGTSTVDIADGGRVRWRDELVCGRHGEDPGDARLGLSVRYGGKPLLEHEFAVGPSAPGWSAAAVLGGAGAIGSLLEVDPDLKPEDPRVLGPASAVLPLAGPGRLTLSLLQQA
ncbi:urease accessory protein UreD [Virgisporangium aliadipatigenens]|uniref:Urease accessory protein UreD n=1 Tax=Virgisporangium aliadipatigenens TaxID=741659 RepID=A0A8J3YPS2_9ACTN|nr:urease accessory protein UreD [Virgisporangium aliadipatigenens]GIJ47775.1 urease accessory protein UreD [Virgisporangium aliadipatigenens]